MIRFEDACSDEDLYAAWLVGAKGPGELADATATLLRDGGYAVSERFADAMLNVAPIDLADFIAANGSFEFDDADWLAHCRRRYRRDGHPALTDDERNGARTTWRR